MKRFFSVIFAMMIILSCVSLFALGASDKSSTPRLTDNAGIIPDEDEKEITELLDSVSEKRKTDVVILTTSTTGGQDEVSYADDYYDNCGFGFGKKKDGILLLICMNPRKIYISTTGKMIKVVPNDDVDSLIDSFYPEIVSGDYSSACKKYAEKVDSEIGSFKLRPVILIPIALVAGFIIAILIVNNMKSGMKTVVSKAQANDYEVANSLSLAVSNDSFLYMNVVKTPRPKETSSSGGTHTSSSGTTHGGGGRSF